MTDLLDTVKAALAKSDAWRDSFSTWPTSAPPDGAYECFSYDEHRDWIRALVSEVERVRGEHELFCPYRAELGLMRDDLSALRQRLAEAVEQAYKEALKSTLIPPMSSDAVEPMIHKAWLASSAKARLT